MARFIVTASDAEVDADTGTATIPYSTFQGRHPDYAPEYWSKLEALFKGGKTLLRDKKLMEDIFPVHRNEHEKIYEERVKCAHYVPYASEIIGNTIAGTAQDQLKFTMEGKKPIPDFYQGFIDDTSRPGKRTSCSLTEFAFERLQEALIKKVSWSQIDLPEVRGEFTSLGEEEKSDARHVYLMAVDNESVIDWEEDDDGDLEFAILMKSTSRRAKPTDSRSKITQEFTILDREGWQIWAIEFDKSKPPSEEDTVRLVGEGDHTFGIVPLLRLELPDELWAMEKLESACRALLRDMNSMLWALRQSCHPELYEFLAAEIGMVRPVGANGEDPGRGTNQTRGQGHVQLRGGGDRAEYVGPEMQAAEFALKVCESHRDEMHRVMNQMGTNTDVSSGTIRRSAESKGMDFAAAEMLYKDYGRRLKVWIRGVFSAVADGRNEKENDNPIEDLQIDGLEKFNERTTEGHIENSALIQSMAIESPTFDRALKMDVIKVHMGDSLSPEQLSTIESELEKAITEETVGGAETYVSDEELATAVASRSAGQIEELDEDDDEDEGGIGQ